ncbi:hypothetical protein SAMCFNEI73_Ch3618 [Sinorhizobium americanum]|uniref:Uncharacterized protein n=1 Tax=Sinorhizobium americanum TaxID=194963 RepID=A0A1L3LS03_9HYPH|nr:hypothetical protein SAMCFNEI73_Ch3618 [Sinorhizobium americanum]
MGHALVVYRDAFVNFFARGTSLIRGGLGCRRNFACTTGLCLLDDGSASVGGCLDLPLISPIVGEMSRRDRGGYRGLIGYDGIFGEGFIPLYPAGHLPHRGGDRMRRALVFNRYAFLGACPFMTGFNLSGALGGWRTLVCTTDICLPGSGCLSLSFSRETSR